MTPKTCDNYGQRNKQTEFTNRVKREQISLRTKFVIVPELKRLIFTIPFI